MGDMKTREQELLEEFKAGLDKDGPVVLVQRIEALEAELDAIAADRDREKERAATAEKDMDAVFESLTQEMEKLGFPRNSGPEDAGPAEKVIFALTGVLVDREELRDEVTKLEKERDEALTQAKSADKARAKVERASAPAKPRKLGATDKGMEGDELREKVEAAEQVEIVFSDGDREISGIAPAIVSGDAWKSHPRGLMLAKPVTIEGPREASSVEIAGYALLIDGKQVAWSERSEPLRVGPGQRVEIVDDIIF